MAKAIIAPRLHAPVIPAPRFTVKIYPAVQYHRPRFLVVATEAHPTPGRIFSAHWTVDEARVACAELQNCAHRWVLVAQSFVCDDCSVRR